METSQNGKRSKRTTRDVNVACLEELLINILSRLPPKSVFRFKCVSKKWKSILAEPFFIGSHYKAKDERVVGYRGERFLAFVSNVVQSIVRDSDTLPLTRMYQDVKKLVPSQFGYIMDSYNGLILTSTDNPVANEFYIVNPLTRMWVALPKTEVCYMLPGLTWEENMHDLNLSYKVVGAYSLDDLDNLETNKVAINTFCSKSGKWEKLVLIGKEDFRISYARTPLVCNGVFYWYSFTNGMVAYHSNRNEKHVQLIMLPGRVSLEHAASVSPCDGVLWYGVDDEEHGIKKIWRLPKDAHFDSYEHATTVEKTKWILMHTFCIQSFYRELDEPFVCAAAANSTLTLLALLPCYPVLAVLSNDEHVFLYNLESKRGELIPHLASSAMLSNLIHHIHTYIESLSLSAYALSTNYY